MAIRFAGKFVQTLNANEEGVLILDKTCFYAEQGGQIYDTGVFSTDLSGDVFSVKNVQIRAGYIVFVGQAEDTLKVGDVVFQTFDENRRWLIMKNHTGTHILNYALQKILGEVEQKGSLVVSDRLRFDFSAKMALTPDQVK